MTRVCVPITAHTCDQMAHEIDVAHQAGAEIIELRLDYLRDWNADSIRHLVNKTRRLGHEVIATCRLANEGGNYDDDESQRISLLEQAGLAGADFIDIEYEAWAASANIRQKIGLLCDADSSTRQPPCRLILSKHTLDKTPADLEGILAKLRAEPAHVIKIACKADAITDSLRMLDALRESAQSGPTIALSMGEAGTMTRVLAKKFDAFLTFASLDVKKASAPGQLTITDMRDLYHWDAIREDSQVYGVIGSPVSHSMSPAILNTSFAATGYNGVYLPMPVEGTYDALAAFLDGCLCRPWLDLRGCSVTIPHKQNVLRYIEHRAGNVEPLARRIGAANTLCIEPGERDDGSDAQVSAFNTDYRGAMDALGAGLDASRHELGKLSVAVLGAGGASRAIVAGLRDGGCRVTIYNRTAEKAQSIAQEFDATALPWDDRTRTHADVIVQCTSIGMWPNIDDSPLPASSLSKNQIVFDTIYNPIDTRLLREARQRGCQTIDGVEMFVRQAAAQFERWTGLAAPTERMRHVVIARLSV